MTGQPVRHLRLNQRLLAKLLTQSYNFQNEGCGNGKRKPPTIGCDGAVDGNPLSLFDDTEFKRLNRHVRPVVGFGASFQVPTVQSGHSDMTWTITRWIAASKAASSFMRGTFDPWGMHVNTTYLGLTYPVDSFTGQDSYPVIAHRYDPVFPLSLVARYQAQNWEPGTDWEKDQFGNFPKDPIQIPGERALFAVLDQADAAAYRFPVAAIPNGARRYVVPSNASMAAAVRHMKPAGNGTLQVNPHSRARNAYPMTMVVYAMVPTSGITAAKAADIARFLDFAAGAGQTPGTLPGQLPAGYLPLPAKLRAQTREAAIKVADQVGRSPARSRAPSSTPAPSPSASPSPRPTMSSPPVPASETQQIKLVAVAHPQAATATRFALPALLIVGGIAALGGSIALAGSASTGLADGLRRTRRRAWHLGGRWLGGRRA